VFNPGLLAHLFARAWFYAGHGGGRALLRKIAAYGRKCRRQAKLLQAALPVDRMPELPPPVLLALDHFSGGGAGAYCRQRLERWPGTALLWQYAPAFDRYLFTVRERGGRESLYRCRGLAPLERWPARREIRSVLVNNLAGWPEPDGLFSFLARFGAGRLEVFLHDFLPVCPSYQLLNHDMAFCRIPADPAICAECLPRNRNASGGKSKDITAWRGSWRRFLSAAGALNAADPSVADLYARVFPELARTIVIKPHQPLAPGWQPLHPPKRPLHIGAVGTLTFSKGAGLVRDLVRLLPSLDRDCRLTVVGEIEADISAPGFAVTGPYRHEDLPALLEELGINVCLVPSIVPETFCYAAQEIIQLGLPLVCLDLGAQGAKARKYARGFPAPTPDAPGCLRAIARAWARCLNDFDP
jgi:hypothetical protein